MHIISILIDITMASFCIFSLLYWLNIYLFHKQLKVADPILYSQIRMKWKNNKEFISFLFKKEFKEKLIDKKLIQKCNFLYFSGYALQWSFNIFVVSFVIWIVLRIYS